MLESTAERLRSIPHARALGLELVSIGERECHTKVPYAPHLIGDPDTGVIHGGVVTALLDNCCGMAVRAGDSQDEPTGMATLDLRIDYLRAARPSRAIHAEAKCHKVTRSVAFVRGLAHDGDPEDPIATCVATFMLNTGAPVPGG